MDEHLVTAGPRMRHLCGLLAELLGDEEFDLPSSQELLGTPRDSAVVLLTAAADGEIVSPEVLLRLLLPLSHPSLPARMIRNRLASTMIHRTALTLRSEMDSDAYMTVWRQAMRTRFLDRDMPVRSSEEAAVLTDVPVRLPMPWPAEFKAPRYSVEMLDPEVDPVPRRRGTWNAAASGLDGRDISIAVTGGSLKRPLTPSQLGAPRGERWVSYNRPQLASDPEGTRTGINDATLMNLADADLARTSWTQIDNEYIVITVKGVGEAMLIQLTKSLQLVARP